MSQPTVLEINPAQRADVCLLLAMIKELAEYEKLAHEVLATEADLDLALFKENPRVAAVVARLHGEAVGYALYFVNFSTFLGKHSLYLEDLFVRPAYRSRGVGKSVLAYLAGLAVTLDCGRFEWTVLDWNQPARQFYEALGARPKSAWINYQITGKALHSLAGNGSSR